MNILNAIEAAAEKTEIMHAEQTVHNMMEVERTKTDAARFRFVVGAIALCVVGWITASVLLQARKYPIHFEFWKRHAFVIPDGKGGVQNSPTALSGEGVHQYTMYQAVLAQYYTPMHSFLSGLTFYESLSPQGAGFLLKSVGFFETQEKTAGKLTLYHWSGGARQSLAHMLFECPGGWLSAGTLSGDMTTTQKEKHIRRNWIESRGQNIWFDFFPNPQTHELAFFSVPCIREVVDKYETCNTKAEAFSELYALYDGGLCAVAASAKGTESAADLFKKMFGENASVRANCAGVAAQAALNGAMMSGMGTMSMMEMTQLSSNITQGATNAASFNAGGMAGILVLSVAASIAGGITSSMAAKERCKAR